MAHTRRPDSVATLKFCSDPDTSRVQVSVPMFLTAIPRIGFDPDGYEGLPTVTVTPIDASAHSNRPWASVLGAALVDGFVTGALTTGALVLGALVLTGPVVEAAFVVGAFVDVAFVDGALVGVFAGAALVVAVCAPVVVTA